MWAELGDVQGMRSVSAHLISRATPSELSISQAGNLPAPSSCAPWPTYGPLLALLFCAGLAMTSAAPGLVPSLLGVLVFSSLHPTLPSGLSSDVTPLRGLP